MNDAFRYRRAAAHENMMRWGWPMKLAISTMLAGFLALTAQLSVPLPWTPVPFTMQVFGVLVVGTVLGRHWGLVSVLIYLAAGALGAPIYSDGAAGFAQLLGFTGGYLAAFAVAAWFVGWYVSRRRHLLDRRTAIMATVGLAALVVSSLVAMVAMARDGATFRDDWDSTRSMLWLFAGMTVLAALAATLWITRARGQGWEKLNLFLVMMGAIGIIHGIGVPVLKLVTHLPWSTAWMVGSAVFIPFDIIKAGLATTLTMAYLPTRDDEAHFMEQAHA